MGSGATDYDRHTVKELDVADAVDELERTLPERITDRLAAWHGAVNARSPGLLGKVSLSERDKRIQAMLRTERDRVACASMDGCGQS